MRPESHPLSASGWDRESRHIEPRVRIEALGDAVPTAHGKLDEFWVGKNPEQAGLESPGDEISDGSRVHAVADCPVVVGPHHLGRRRP